MAKNAKKALAKFSKEMKMEGDELTAYIKSSVSKSAAGLFAWSYATTEYYDIFRMVEPKKAKAKEMQIQMDKSQASL